MTFKLIANVVNGLMSQAAWAHQRRFWEICQVWQDIIPEKTKLHSRPLMIARNVLWVATSSAVWSQQLTLQRYGLLKKINAHLTEPLDDFRFSEAHWHHQPLIPPLADVTGLHPSRLPAPDRPPEKPQTDQNLADLVKHWLEKQQGRTLNAADQSHQPLPPCPQCQSATPPGELQRWGICRCCIAQSWHQAIAQQINPSTENHESE